MEANSKARCYFCGHGHPLATNLEDETLKPKKGDLSVCINCGRISIYSEDLTTRQITEGEWEDLCKNHPDVVSEAMRATIPIRERYTRSN